MNLYRTLTLLSLFFVTLTTSAEEFSAQVGWADVRQLGVPISGQVNQLNVVAGSYPKSGDTLLTLACGVYEAQLKQHQSIAKALIPAVETALKEKELADELFERTVLSEVEHRNAELVYIKSKAQQDEARAKVKQAEIRVGFCELKADDALMVLKVHVKNGEMYTQESAKPVLMTVASRDTMLATTVLALPLKKVYRTGVKATVNVAGKNHKGRIQAVNYLAESIEISAEFDFFDPRLFGNTAAKIIIQ